MTGFKFGDSMIYVLENLLYRVHFVNQTGRVDLPA